MRNWKPKRQARSIHCHGCAADLSAKPTEVTTMLNGRPVITKALRAPPRVALTVTAEGIGWGGDGDPLQKPTSYAIHLCEICAKAVAMLHPDVLTETIRTVRGGAGLALRRRLGT